jgi:heme A synthase
MIQQFPHTEQSIEIERPARPASLLTAAKVMYVGAAAALIQAILYLATESATKAAIAAKNPHMSASTVSTVAHAGVIVGAVVALIAMLVLLRIARRVLRGRNWARVAATVLFVVSVLGTAYDLSNAVAQIVAIFDVVITLIWLASVVLLWTPASSAYFKFFRRPQF